MPNTRWRLCAAAETPDVAARFKKGTVGFRDWHWNPKFLRNTLALCLSPGATTNQVAAVGLPLIALRLGRRHLGNRMDIQRGKGYDGFCKEGRVS